ncbi:putative diguanylate cyclase/phosphodiesterase (GGDEF & EAL domains) with Phytochrome (GAF) sensor [Planktothrix serta PCC 8927]|uniref:Diguanylate cyclase/phosphodiesterase (GGDEF & EAL domains) with Phytochrome (GAF) sensor n=1 Tax=Planktothrix serta PCC 8927 TaxID=671068 RepID=A0A7Z9BRA6_9CYAN|nr:diguanylate cyclase [Planktothrix serta]VXD20767.1 putative diguanylate cyclase/phosphodiesterase (GGDEF & EAL domains) with Phytochrome (GAF) sensor [Planktothrix serta PCC 8927]
MNTLLKKILTPKQIEYLTINSEFVIVEISWGVARFSDSPEQVQSGSDVFIAFPELIGLEETFRKILYNQVNQFELKGISRTISRENSIYFDIYVLRNPENFPHNQELLILLEDTTELLVKEQKITQVAKEYGLALSSLEKTKIYLDKIINSMTDILIVTDNRGVIKITNQSTTVSLSYSKEELLQQSILIIFEDDKFKNGRQISEFLSSSDLVIPIEIICKTKTGTYFPVSFSCAALNFDPNDTQEFVWIGRDMSEQKRVEFKFRQQAERDRVLKTITQRIHQSLSLQETLQTIVIEVRNFLKADRVLIYRFYSSEAGQVIAESVSQACISTLDKRILTQDFNALLLSHFQSGKIDAIDNLYLMPIDLDYLRPLLQLKVKASLVVPILIYNSSQQFDPTNQLWGLLMAHQCQQPRHWEVWEVNLLEELAVQIAIALQQAELYEQLQIVNQELEQLAILDGLTGLSNRRHFDRVLYQEWNRSRREETAISLFLLDIDYFKQYNDTYGHLAGDFCLQQVAQVLRNVIQRNTDLVARYGGEEFAIILPNTNISNSVHLAEKICQQVEALQIPHLNSEVSDYVTISIGVASLIPMEHLTPQALLHSADQALYQAKQNGRNCIIIASP